MVPAVAELSPPRLSIRGLRIEGPARTLVDGVDLDVAAGEIVALVGESGSGKSLTGSAAIGLVPPGLAVTGSVRVDDTDLVGLPERSLRAVRGARVAMVFQEPQTALNPSRRIGTQIGDALRAHRRRSRSEVRDGVIRLLGEVGIDDARRRMRAYPHQLSGGQRQRVVIAIALAGAPEVIVADEPTTALDATVQAGILDLFRRLSDERGVGILLITHDMGVVAHIADRVAVMYRGEVIETGSTASVLRSPSQDHTRRLVAAVPRLATDPRPATVPRPATDPRPAAVPGPTTEAAPSVGEPDPATPVVEVRGVSVRHPGTRAGPPALRDVSLTIGRGEFVGLVGESGSGKSTLGRAVLGIIPPTEGTVTCRATSTALVHQDPFSSLDPRWTVRRSIAEPLRLRGDDPSSIRSRVDDLLDAVALPRALADTRPGTLSGGQRQRVALARALGCDPDLVVADEPTSALDVANQATVLDLFADLRDRIGFAALFITHDLAVVTEVADRVAVLRGGHLVEVGTPHQILHAPTTAYTRDLVAAVPRLDDGTPT